MLQIEYVPISQICEYRNNTKIHTDEQVDRIAKSITEFGFKDPIAIYGSDGRIVEGHGRYLAAKKLGLETVPVIRLDDLSDDQIKAYSVIHNKLNMETGFDTQRLEIELLGITSISMPEFGFTVPSLALDTIPKFTADTIYENHDADDSDEGEDGTADDDIPDEFPEFDEDIPTTHKCPHCGFEWR